MKHIIVSVGQRLITLLVAFGLLNPSAGSYAAVVTAAPSGDNASSIANEVLASPSSNMQANAVQDGEVDWVGLEHDSRSTTYRTPAGPVATGTSVILRLRATSGDLTAAQVRVFNDRQNTLSILDMSVVVDDGTYEWWQVTLPPSSLPTVYWYRFIAIDNSDIDYYADDNDLLGGPGSPTEEEVDNGWQLTFYDPAFHTPDWVKDSIIYEIFPDRFRDGDVSNNDLPDFYYGEDTAIFRSGTIYWNEEICDPLNSNGLCPDIYGENFYGGDLQGIMDRLDYIKNLGVSALYINPIFKSPSNDGQDTTNYQSINSRIGSDALLSNLITQAALRNMRVILDGVFNYTSSDSIYFDRYELYPGINGSACEKFSSPYRDWYFFYDVAPGTGACVGSNGIDNAADYLSWQENDHLPLLNSANTEVQELIWKESSSTADPIATQWLTTFGAYGWRLDLGGEIDPGILSNPANLYWEGFRNAVFVAKPDTLILGDEFGDSSSWILGSEWDASTNYQLSTTILGFWRDEPFTDNDHYPGSAAGVIEPLLPTELNDRLLNLQERYTPEAFASMMNLLDSHDTNRALFMLDHNTDNNDSSLYWNSSYNWNDAITRLKGAVLLQMTLPGAPTIYYGDEVGLVGPVSFDTQSNTWLDNPYNHQPYPWLGANCTANCGIPYYASLQIQANQDSIRNYYTLLTSTRNIHPALRGGSFDPLLWDHPSVYAFGRRYLATDDAAVVVLNRSSQTQSVTLDLSGYLPETLTLIDVLHNNTAYTIPTGGSLTLNNIPAMSGLLLVNTSGDLTQPPAPQNLVAIEAESQVTLTWSEVSGTASYQIYRSYLTGGGYELIGTTSSTNFVDTTVFNGMQYYYVVRSVKLLGVVSEFSGETTALPHWVVDEAFLQSPAEITHTIGLAATQPVYGRLLIDEETVAPGALPGILAQLGYGSSGTLPSEWTTWQEAIFDSDQESFDQYSQPLLPEAVGDFQFVYRYSTNHGRDWEYADLDGLFVGLPINPGLLHVLPSADITPPTTPANLTLDDWGDHFVTLSWDPLLNDASLYAYDIYRSIDIGSSGVPIGRVLSPITEYTDTQVNSGITYYYRVQAVDTSFNRSIQLSNQVTALPVTRKISVTFIVDVPDYTQGEVYIVGDHLKLGSWDPGKILMTRVDANTWRITLDFEEGIFLEYKFTRGNYAWLDVETAADGNTSIPNRKLLVEAGDSGTQTANSTVANWRDPQVAFLFPAAGATDVQINPVIRATWNQAMDENTSITLTNGSVPITGTLSYDPISWTVSFTPSELLLVDTTYTITAEYQTDIAGDPQLVRSSWTFTTIETITIHTVALPMVRKK